MTIDKVEKQYGIVTVIEWADSGPAVIKIEGPGTFIVRQEHIKPLAIALNQTALRLANGVYGK